MDLLTGSCNESALDVLSRAALMLECSSTPSHQQPGKHHSLPVEPSGCCCCCCDSHCSQLMMMMIMSWSSFFWPSCLSRCLRLYLTWFMLGDIEPENASLYLRNITSEGSFGIHLLGWLVLSCSTEISSEAATQGAYAPPSAKYIIFLVSDFSECTLCLKKVPTFKLSVTLSNLNRFFKIFTLLESVWNLLQNPFDITASP